MKLKNKKTGEIREIKGILIDGMFEATSLAALNAEWEDYEEPKEVWVIDNIGEVFKMTEFDDEIDRKTKEIGFWFETKEEAEKAVNKLKAWKRLKDKGFRFDGYNAGGRINYYIDRTLLPKADLDLLFGDKE